jgi:hypothetical protein
MTESMPEGTKLLLGHVLYRVKQMICAMIQDGDWPSEKMPSDNTIAQTLLELRDDGQLNAAIIEELALERLMQARQDA